MSATLSGQVEGFVLLLTSYKDLLSGRDDFIYYWQGYPVRLEGFLMLVAGISGLVEMIPVANGRIPQVAYLAR